MKGYGENTGGGIFPTVVKVDRSTEVAPDVWLITDPTFQPNLGKWTALARAYGGLAVVELKVWIDEQVLVAV